MQTECETPRKFNYFAELVNAQKPLQWDHNEQCF